MSRNYIILPLLTLMFTCFSASNLFAQSTDDPSNRYYHNPGKIHVNLGLNFFTKARAVTAPVFINPEVTVMNNLTVGGFVTYYKYKHFLQHDTLNHFTEWFEEENAVEYSHMLFGAKATYHLNDILKKGININMPDQYELYVTGWMGYNITNATGAGSTDAYEKEAVRAGGSIGVRYLYSKGLGFFLEGSVNSYNWGAVGATFIF